MRRILAVMGGITVLVLLALPTMGAWGGGGVDGGGACSDPETGSLGNPWSAYACHEDGGGGTSPCVSSTNAELLDKYLPSLRFDTNETAHNADPSVITDSFVWPSSEDHTNSLQDSVGAFAQSDPAVAQSEARAAIPDVNSILRLSFLRDIYPRSRASSEFSPSDGFRREETPSEVTDHLSARSSLQEVYEQDAAEMEDLPGRLNKFYGRVHHSSTDDRIWLQYWMFYYFNGKTLASEAPFADLGLHEGDWEWVQVGLNDCSLQPEWAAYAQHGHPEKCPWYKVEKDNGQPVVYVALGSHASYFRKAPYIDRTWEKGDGLKRLTTWRDVEPIDSSTPSWMEWEGLWGDSGPGAGGSPPSPAFQPAWPDPAAWANNDPWYC